jgi:hypothetical protein
MAYIRTHGTTERETPVFVAHVRGELVAQSFGAVSAFHSRTVLSPPPLTSRCPSGLNATLVTCWPCPLSQARGVKFSLKIWTRRSRDR